LPFIHHRHKETNAMSDGKIRDGRTDPKCAKAIQRRGEIRAQNANEVEQIVTELLGGLGRPAVGGERVTAEVIASTLVAGRRLRERGRSDAAERQLLRSLLSYSPFGMSPPAPPAHLDPSPAGTFRVVTKGGDPAPDEATNG
jgi:hypothetical protein